MAVYPPDVWQDEYFPAFHISVGYVFSFPGGYIFEDVGCWYFLSDEDESSVQHGVRHQ